MTEFKTYLFEENALKTRNKKVSKERLYYIAIVVFLVAVILLILDSPYTGEFLAVAIVLVVIGQIIMSGRIPSVGHRPTTLTISKDFLKIGDNNIVVKGKNDMLVKILGYRRELVPFPTGFYETKSGNENIVRITYKNKQAEFNFVLESEHQRDELLEFCKENGIKYIK